MSPNKTLYIRDADMPIWEEAEQRASALGESLSQLAAQALRAHLATMPAEFKVIVMNETNSHLSLDGPNEGHLRYERQRGDIHAWRLLYLDDSGEVDDEILGVGLSPKEEAKAVEEARSFLRNKALGGAEMERITVETGGDYDRTEGFVGRWLVAPDSDETRTGEDGWDAGTYWGIALTKKGQIAVYTAHCNQRQPGRLRAYRSLDQAEGDIPDDILAMASEALGIKRVIWRDI